MEVSTGAEVVVPSGEAEDDGAGGTVSAVETATKKPCLRSDRYVLGIGS